MRRLIPSLIALVLVLCSAFPLQAQEETTELADLVQVTEFTVAPGHAAQFEAGVHKYLEAAKLAEIPEKYSFDVYQYDDRYVMVGFPENMAEFDEDEDAWMERFMGTPGEAVVMEAFGMFEGLDMQVHSTIMATMKDWTHLPPGGWAPTHAGIVVIDNWVAPGHSEAFGENSVKIAAALTKMGYPYPVIAHRTRIGDEGRYRWAIFHDGLANYHGEKSIEAHLEKAGMFEEWGAIFEERAPLMSRIASYDAMYRPDLSYRPGM